MCSNVVKALWGKLDDFGLFRSDDETRRETTIFVVAEISPSSTGLPPFG